jgi:hypothetical protein
MGAISARRVAASASSNTPTRFQIAVKCVCTMVTSGYAQFRLFNGLFLRSENETELVQTRRKGKGPSHFRHF